SPSAIQPTVRLRVDGGIGIFNGNGATWNPSSGTIYIANGAFVVLSNNSAFSTTPAPIISTNVSATGSTVGSFVPVPAYASTLQYVGFRLPDFPTSGSKPQLWWQVGATGGS